MEYICDRGPTVSPDHGGKHQDYVVVILGLQKCGIGDCRQNRKQTRERSPIVLM